MKIKRRLPLIVLSLILLVTSMSASADFGELSQTQLPGLLPPTLPLPGQAAYPACARGPGTGSQAGGQAARTGGHASVESAGSLSITARGPGNRIGDDGIQTDSDWHIEVVDGSAYDYVGQDSSLALDASGYPHISYTDPGHQELKVARWDGETWHIETVDKGNLQYTSLALDTSGHPRIAYYEGEQGALKYAAWDGTEWQIETVDSATPYAGVGTYASLALDAQNHPHISYYDADNRALKYATWDGRHWRVETVDSQRVKGYTSLALASSGHPHISYCSDPDYIPQMRHAWWDGRVWQIETVVEGGYPKYTSLALDGLDYSHIAYYDYYTRTLQYAVWDGETYEIETVDTGTTYGVGEYASLALDTSGHPHISYYNADNRALKYATWNGEAWQIETVETGAGDHGTSLALDAEGSPHISYHDGHRLKYAYREFTPPILAVVDIYTDKSEYTAGETLHLGADITISEQATSENWWLLVLLRTPTSGVTIAKPVLHLPPGWEYSNPDFLTWRLESIAPGFYVWTVLLFPVGEAPVVDSAIWTFSGSEASQLSVETLKDIQLNLEHME